jgi:hypothetical protein
LACTLPKQLCLVYLCTIICGLTKTKRKYCKTLRITTPV